MNLGAPTLHTTCPPTEKTGSKSKHKRNNIKTTLASPKQHEAQKHFLCTIVGPDSSYSLLEIHICWKVLKEDKMEPPIHTEYLRSGGATTLIFMVEGANAVSSFVMRSPIPANMVVPPDSTTFA